MYTRQFTPDRITELQPNQIFVFGSNLAGSHGGGAALLAYRRFGAVWGQGVGPQGYLFRRLPHAGRNATICSLFSIHMRV